MQTECFLYSSSKDGLNAVLGVGEGQKSKMPNVSNLYSMPMNDGLLLLLGQHITVVINVSDVRA